MILTVDQRNFAALFPRIYSELRRLYKDKYNFAN